MFTLATNEFDKQFNYVGVKGKTTLAFDNVIKMFEVLKDNLLVDKDKLFVALALITDIKPEIIMKIDEPIQMELLTYLVDEFVMSDKPVLTPSSEIGKKPKEYYNITQDADYIYASFMQDYGIDLFEQQGKLHWYKFKALLAGLSDETKFKRVVEIRMKDPNEKGLSAKEKRQIRDAQMVYALNITEEDVEFSKLDEDGKQKYLETHPIYAMELQRIWEDEQ